MAGDFAIECILELSNLREDAGISLRNGFDLNRKSLDRIDRIIKKFHGFLMKP